MSEPRKRAGDIARPTLRGPRVVLRAPRATDVADRLALGRDPEFRRMVGAAGPAPGPFTQADAERWHHGLELEPHGWVVEYDGHCIGVARLHSVDSMARSAHLAVGLFAPQHRGLGLGTEAVQLLLDQAFNALALSVVRFRVLAFNARARSCYGRCGFREIAREAVNLNGERTEDVIMAITAVEYRAHSAIDAV